jgi:hypothetical protein
MDTIAPERVTALTDEAEGNMPSLPCSQMTRGGLIMITDNARLKQWKACNVMRPHLCHKSSEPKSSHTRYN